MFLLWKLCWIDSYMSKSNVVKLRLKEFLDLQGAVPTASQLEAMEAILNCPAVLRMHACGSGKTYMFNLLERFLRERGGDVLHQTIIESRRGLH